MYYALYMQYGNRLELEGEISPQEISPRKEQRNFVILCSSAKCSFDHFLPRRKGYLRENGIKIIRNAICDNVWY